MCPSSLKAKLRSFSIVSRVKLKLCTYQNAALYYKVNLMRKKGKITVHFQPWPYNNTMNSIKIILWLFYSETFIWRQLYGQAWQCCFFLFASVFALFHQCLAQKEIAILWLPYIVLIFLLNIMYNRDLLS